MSAEEGLASRDRSGPTLLIVSVSVHSFPLHSEGTYRVKMSDKSWDGITLYLPINRSSQCSLSLLI